MGTRRTLKFLGNCKVMKVIKKGKQPKVFLKCYGKPKINNSSAQRLIDSLK